MARFATGFFHEANILDAHAAVDRFGHVVDGQQADGGGGQSFHLDTSTTEAFGGDCAVDGVLFLVDGEIGSNAGQRNRMAERNQVAGSFRGLNGRDTGDAEDVAFLGGAAADEGQRFGAHENAAGGSGNTGGFGFGADIDHVGLAGAIEMSQDGVGHERYVWLRSAGMAVLEAALS